MSDPMTAVRKGSDESGRGLAEAEHWLVFNRQREVTRCRCGFAADPDDCGYGDSVIEHIINVVEQRLLEVSK